MRALVVAMALCALAGCGKSKKGGGGGDDLAAGKASEAEISLKKLMAGVKVYYEVNAALPVGSAPLTPTPEPCGGNGVAKKHAPDLRLWEGSPWRDVEFQMEDPHYFSYSYEATATTISLRAEADLDCDGTPMKLLAVGEIRDGSLSLYPNISKSPD